MEHRWGERAEIEIPVELHYATGVIATGTIINASVSGAFIRTSTTQPFMARIDIQIGGQAVPAFVVRNGSGGLGIEWCDLAPEMIGALLLVEPVAVEALQALSSSQPGYDDAAMVHR